MKARDVLKMLRQEVGFFGITKAGSHRQFVHAVKAGKVTVAGYESDEIPPKTLSQDEASGHSMNKFLVLFERSNTGYGAYAPDLPGCLVTQALTLDELFVNIREAIDLHLEGEDLAELGIAPNPTVLATMEFEAVA